MALSRRSPVLRAAPIHCDDEQNLPQQLKMPSKLTMIDVAQKLEYRTNIPSILQNVVLA
jgi:hypothetical protein